MKINTFRYNQCRISNRGCTQSNPIPQIPTVPNSTIIPFSISKYGTTLITTPTGDPMVVASSGYGYASTSYLQEDDWENGQLTITANTQYCTSFMFPHNGTIRSMYVMISTGPYGLFEEGSTIRPFACIAISKADELVYKILPETMLHLGTYEGGVQYTDYTTRSGSKSDLNIKVEKGMLFAILLGITAENVTYEQYGAFFASGGILLS